MVRYLGFLFVLLLTPAAQAADECADALLEARPPAVAVAAHGHGAGHERAIGPSHEPGHERHASLEAVGQRRREEAHGAAVRVNEVLRRGRAVRARAWASAGGRGGARRAARVRAARAAPGCRGRA